MHDNSARRAAQSRADNTVRICIFDIVQACTRCTFLHLKQLGRRLFNILLYRNNRVLAIQAHIVFKPKSQNYLICIDHSVNCRSFSRTVITLFLNIQTRGIQTCTNIRIYFMRSKIRAKAF